MTKKGSSEFFLNKIEIFGGQKGKLSNFCSKRAVMNCSKNMLCPQQCIFNTQDAIMSSTETCFVGALYIAHQFRFSWNPGTETCNQPAVLSHPLICITQLVIITQYV